MHQSGSFPKKDMEPHLKLLGSYHHSPSPPYSRFSNPVSLMGLGVSLVDSGNGNGKPPLKWVTLFFFGYFAKWGYRNARKPTQSTNICSFIQRLNLHNSNVTQVMARIWHNIQPRKVGIFIWLTLNRGLLVGT